MPLIRCGSQARGFIAYGIVSLPLSWFARSPERKPEGHAEAQLGQRAIVEAAFADADIDGGVFAHLPDRTEEPGDGVERAELALVQHLRDRPNRPVHRAFG